MGPRILNGEKVFSINGAGITRYPHNKRIKLDPYLIPLTKIDSKLIKDLNVIPETMKLLEENIGIKLLDVVMCLIGHLKHRQQN